MPHGLDTSIRTARVVGRIRAPFPSPRAVSAAVDPGADADVVPLPRRDGAPARDGVERRAAVGLLDGQNRLSLGKVLTALGWDAATPLVAVCSPREVVITAGTALRPTLTPVPVDGDRRLTLGPTITGALDVGPGEQVVAVAVPSVGELHLRAAADALQLITGAFISGGADQDQAAVAPTARSGRSGVKARWKPPSQ